MKIEKLNKTIEEIKKTVKAENEQLFKLSVFTWLNDLAENGEFAVLKKGEIIIEVETYSASSAKDEALAYDARGHVLRRLQENGITVSDENYGEGDGDGTRIVQFLCKI